MFYRVSNGGSTRAICGGACENTYHMLFDYISWQESFTGSNTISLNNCLANFNSNTLVSIRVNTNGKLITNDVEIDLLSNTLTTVNINLSSKSFVVYEN